MSTSDALLQELEDSVRDLLKLGEHDGSCTNEHQMKLAVKIAPCRKHEEVLSSRKERVENALMQFRLLRDVFSGVKDDRF